MIDINPSLSVIILNFCSLHQFKFKRTQIYEYILYIQVYKKPTLNLKHIKKCRLKKRNGERHTILTFISQKKVGVPILLLDRENCRARKIVKDNKGHYIQQMLLLMVDSSCLWWTLAACHQQHLLPHHPLSLLPVGPPLQPPAWLRSPHLFLLLGCYLHLPDTSPLAGGKHTCTQWN